MIKVKLYGIAKDIVSSSFLEIEANISVKSLKENIIRSYPAFTSLRSVLIAVNDEYALDEQMIMENDDVALIPPVSGG